MSSEILTTVTREVEQQEPVDRAATMARIMAGLKAADDRDFAFAAKITESFVGCFNKPNVDREERTGNAVDVFVDAYREQGEKLEEHRKKIEEMEARKATQDAFLKAYFDSRPLGEKVTALLLVKAMQMDSELTDPFLQSWQAEARDTAGKLLTHQVELDDADEPAALMMLAGFLPTGSN
ncbi:MAG: hypothetical protein IH624_07535 [Phycisphaerae bacterium]|nr:hypothetical protein [Phycisphaerae bacterium]